MNRDGLIFEWPGRHHLHLLLPFAVLAAILVHIALFFLFSIIYPRPDPGAVNTAEVIVVPPGSAAAERLAALLESEDPSVFAPGHGLPAPNSHRSGYTPQYASAKAVLEPMPESPAEPARVRPRFGPVQQPTGEFPAPPAPRPPPVLRLTAAGDLAGRVPPNSSALAVWLDPESNPRPMEFLAAVRPDGSIANLFPQQSSGSEAFDRRAAGVVRSLRLAPGPGNPAWGILTLSWGTP